MPKTKLTFDEARGRFAQFGTCEHDPDFESKFEVPGCNLYLIDCTVCGKRLGGPIYIN